jgi:hypothetical protein
MGTHGTQNPKTRTRTDKQATHRSNWKKKKRNGRKSSRVLGFRFGTKSPPKSTTTLYPMKRVDTCSTRCKSLTAISTTFYFSIGEISLLETCKQIGEPNKNLKKKIENEPRNGHTGRALTVTWLPMRATDGD